MDERLLVRLAIEGDGQAFATLVNSQDEAVRRVVRAFVGLDDADDVVQSAYLKTWQGLRSFDGRSSFGTWLRRIAVNASLDHLRRERSTRVPSTELEAAEQTGEADDLRKDALAWALRRTRQNDRLLLKLQLQEGRSYEEIARVFGIAPSTVGTRLFRARARVRQLARRRLAQLLAALLAGILAASSLGYSDALATLGFFIRRVVLQQSESPSVVEELTLLRLNGGIDEAQTLVPWRVRVAEPPDGFSLADVFTGSIHAFASGPTVWLHYRRVSETGEQVNLDVVQTRASGDAVEPVAEGSASWIPLGDGKTALFVDGRWASRAGSRQWYRGDVIRLIIEADQEDDVLVQIQGDPREGWNLAGLLEVAHTLR